MLRGIKPTVDFVFKKVFGSPENIPVLIGGPAPNAILKLAHPNLQEETISASPAIERWAFFFFVRGRLRAGAIAGIVAGSRVSASDFCGRAIAAKTEDRMMYDHV